jgi:broad specificity phosphatase PhoE
VPIELWYETHSTTLDNEQGIATGWLPGELSGAGRRQARELGERIRERRLDVLYVSDLARALETATLAVGDTGLTVIVDERLRECNYGELNGCPIERLAAERSRRIDTPFPGGESYCDVVERTASFLSDLAEQRNGQRVGVIAHSANRWALEHLLHSCGFGELVEAPFAWQPGWRFMIAADWRPNLARRSV